MRSRFAIVAMLEQNAPNDAHANHKLEVVQGSRMNLKLINPEREARVHSADVSVGMAVEDCSGPTCSTHTYRHASSQAHINDILECMGCEDYDGSV